MKAMTKGAGTFEPRLCQLFRHISNPERMNVFRTVSLSPDPNGISVLAVTDLVRLHEPATSTYLKQLSACGLLVGKRNKRFQYYRVTTSERADGADIIAQMLAVWFVRTAGKLQDWGPMLPELPFGLHLPALANRLRTVILRYLSDGRPHDVGEVSESTRIPADCCKYHLDLLARHGLASESPEDEYQFVTPLTEEGRLMVELSICDDPDAFRKGMFTS